MSAALDDLPFDDYVRHATVDALDGVRLDLNAKPDEFSLRRLRRALKNRRIVMFRRREPEQRWMVGQLVKVWDGAGMVVTTQELTTCAVVTTEVIEGLLARDPREKGAPTSKEYVRRAHKTAQAAATAATKAARAKVDDLEWEASIKPRLEAQGSRNTPMADVLERKRKREKIVEDAAVTGTRVDIRAMGVRIKKKRAPAVVVERTA